MASTGHHVLLFGDQTDNVVGSIDFLYVARKQSGLLAKFLRDASDVCQIEFGYLQPCFREETPPFESLLEMAENHAKTDGSPVLASCAVSYFARLGELILRAEQDPTILSTPRVCVGLCISLFPAALAATARNASELAKLSLEAFPSYFRMAVSNHVRTKRVEWPHGTWSCMVSKQTDDNLQPLLDKFHEEHDIPKHKRTWIGVVGRGWVSVSGPPSTLQRLMATPSALKDLQIIPLPVASAVHAPHLPALNFDSTVKDSYIWKLPLQEVACIMSTSDCTTYSSKKLGDVARQILSAITQEPLLVDGTFTATAEYLKGVCATAAAVSVLGPSAQASSLIQTINQAGIEVEVLPQPECKLKLPNLSVRSGSGAVAIIGMSARFPQANDLEQFWKLLMQGRTTHERIPHDRFDLDDFYDPMGTKKNTMINTDGCFLSDPGAFDPRLFNMSPREAMQVDPTHRLLLMTSLEALEKAGYNPDAGLSSRNKRTAVYFGQNADVWREIDAQQGVDVFTVPGLLRAFSPGRVSYHFGFEGGSYSLDSACSSSATAIQLACSALINRECDMALAGGAQIASSPFEFSALGKSGFLAPSGGCKTFTADADGYCRGEAVGVVVLKRLEDALADNDNTDALITGWGRNYSGGASYMTFPHPASQEKLIRQVLRQANVKPGDIGYVELHGTGTIAGDMAEMSLITNVFGGHFEPKRPLHVGAVKANVGHSESAAGVSSVIKAALMLREGIIPPQAGITPNTQLHPGFAGLPMSTIRIDSESATLDGNKNKILINSFDAAGGNTCLLIEKAPMPVENAREPDIRSSHLVTLSAQTDESLRGNRERLLEYLVKYPETQLRDVAYSTTARRTQYSRRAHYTAESTDQLLEKLSNDIAHPSQSVTPIVTKPKTIFLFDGQGPGYFYAAKELYDTYPIFQDSLHALTQTCQSLCPGLIYLPNIMCNPYFNRKGDSLVEQHLFIVCLQLALAELWQSWGIKPDIVMGHSIGEYAALCVAGVLSVSDTLWLVSKRAELLKTTCRDGDYGMLMLSATEYEIQAILREHKLDNTCSIACFNSHICHVVGGPTVNLLELKQYADSKGIHAKILSMHHAFHTEQMEDIYEGFEKIGNSVTFLRPQIPVASTVMGEMVHGEEVFNAEYIARHAREPVRFSNALKSIDAFLAKEQASPIWVEIGPTFGCLNHVRKTLNTSFSQLLPTLNKDNNDWMTLSSSLGKAYTAGSSVDWLEFHRPFAQSLRLLDLPTYSFELKTFWQPYTTATAAASGINMGDERREKFQFIPTATIQKILHAKVSADRIEVMFVSSLDDSRLRDTIKGHVIEGICICPASVYVDMAFTAAAYVQGKVLQDKKRSLGSLKCLEVKRPFVLRDNSESQTIEVRVMAEKDDGWKANVSFYSQTGAGQLEEHGSCQVLGNDETERGSEWEDMIGKIRTRSASIMSMQHDASARIDILHRRMFYKLYDTAVEYDSRYQGITEAFIPEISEDDIIRDAVAEVRLTATSERDADAFMLSPYHGDSLVHLGGFALNINSDDSADILHFSSGIDSITLFDKLREGNTYLSYFCTLQAPEGESIANIFIFSQDQVVGVVTGLKFRQIQKDVLKALLGEPQANGTPIAAVQARIPAIQGHPRGLSVAVEVTSPPSPDVQGNMADAFIAALIAETGIDPEDVEDSTKLSELGVDSLMGIAILRKMNDDTGMILPVTIFQELRTIRDVRERLCTFNNMTSHGANQNSLANNDSSEINHDVTYSPEHNLGDDNFLCLRNLSVDLVARYRSNIVLLQGDARSPHCPIIFVAGSSGSASIYAQLPPLESGTPVWVLESPFLDYPSEMEYTPQEIAPIYTAAVKTIRPTGPYLLGGYSAGAVHAYEISRLLLENGDEVKKLILVDMKAHCPGESWDEAPQMQDVEQLTGILGTDGDAHINERLFASLRCMYNWKPVPMDPNHRPTNGTVMIWARRGMCQNRQVRDIEIDEEVNPMAAENRNYKTWFYASRHTYEANGWDVLVGDVQPLAVDGDHWSMLEMPCAASVSELIDQARHQ
ncbi:ketoacyl-synt-domain-containing protein [Xylariaceae sp. AK1471]|nr:ketoacyl-synt-domain-containing protein [Xylariaceae sp. AK1471]